MEDTSPTKARIKQPAGQPKRERASQRRASTDTSSALAAMFEWNRLLDDVAEIGVKPPCNRPSESRVVAKGTISAEITDKNWRAPLKIVIFS